MSDTPNAYTPSFRQETSPCTTDTDCTVTYCINEDTNQIVWESHDIKDPFA